MPHRTAKDGKQPCKRPSFATRKATFHSLKDGLLD